MSLTLTFALRDSLSEVNSNHLKLGGPGHSCQELITILFKPEASSQMIAVTHIMLFLWVIRYKY